MPDNILKKIIKIIDEYLDGISMYRLILYYLGGLLLLATILSIFGDLHYSPLAIVISTAILLISCWTMNKGLAYIFNAPVNNESALITALILSLIIGPQLNFLNIVFLLAASGLAMASKYILSIKKKHIFNPAAIAVLLTAFGARQSANWWVGTAYLMPFVLIGGLLLAHRIQRLAMIGSYLISTTIFTVIFALASHAAVSTSLSNMILTSGTLFLGFVMLTEPLTSPATLKKQYVYGALVGALLPPQVHIFSLYSTPELSLVVGNIYNYVVSSKVKLFPVFVKKEKIAVNSYDFLFEADQPISYKPGQYMEWTLPHTNTDARGDRRYFTLASSPTEDLLRIGVKFYENGSSYKEALMGLDSDSEIVASQIGGDFTLPEDKDKKLVFIAGGIGITPFRSMIKYMLDTNDQRIVNLIYLCRELQDVAYMDILKQAEKNLSFSALYLFSNKKAKTSSTNMQNGYISTEIIEERINDIPETIYYISGSRMMVMDVTQMLHQLGVHHSHIHQDFFPGYS